MVEIFKGNLMAIKVRNLDNNIEAFRNQLGELHMVSTIIDIWVFMEDFDIDQNQELSFVTVLSKAM